MRNHILTVGLMAVTAIASWTANADEWQTKLQSVIRQFDTNAVVTVEKGRYVYRYHTQKFKIHAIDKVGTISETTHDEEGPNVDGIFLTVSLQDGPYHGALVIPQDLHRPYWTTFANAYTVADGKYLWLTLSYGSRADKKLMEAVKTCFEKIEKAQPPASGDGKPAPQP